MITPTLKGENYAERLEVAENDDEALLKEIVRMGSVTLHMLHRISGKSINQCEQIVKRLRRAGFVEVTADSAAGKVANTAFNVIKNIAKGTQHISGEKISRLALGNSNALVSKRKKLPTEEQRREQREVLRGR